MKRATIFLFIFLFSITVFSQIKYGVYLGTSTLNIKSDQLEFVKSKPSVNFGVGLDYLFTDHFEIIVEAGYSNKKPIFKAYDNEALNNPHEVTLNYTGLDYNIVANYNFLDNKISAQAGLSGNAVISNFKSLTGHYVKGLYEFSHIMPTYGLLFGISAGKENLRLNLRYGISLNNPYAEISYFDENDNQIDVIGKHNSFSLSLIYYIIQ